MKKVSRITNSIYLQQGLIDGTIPPDDLLTDILKLKFTKSSDVVEMDSAKMKAGVGSLKTLAQSIKPTDAMKTNLRYYLALDTIHDAIQKQTDGGEWPEANNIKTIVKNFKDNEIALSVVDKLLEYVETIDEKIKKMEKPHDFSSQTGVLEVYIAFLSLKEKGTLFESDSKLISQEHVDYKSINNIESVLPSLAVVHQKVKAVQKCKENSSLLSHDSNTDAASFESFKKIDNFSKNDHKNQLTVISELHRQSNSARSSQYSFPFMDSGKNIFGLSDALKDPWMKSVFKSDGFPESLEQISSMGELLRKINDSLVMKDKISMELQNFFEIIDLVSSVDYNSKEAEGIAEELSKCEKDISRNQLQLDEIEELLKQLRGFDNAIKDLKQAFIDFVDFSKNQEFQKVLSDVVEISRKCTSQDASVVKLVLQEYQQFANLKKFTKDISQLKDQVDKIKELKTALKESASKVDSNADKITSLKADYDKFFSKGFDCLLKIVDTKPLTNMMFLAQKLNSVTTMTTGFNEIDKFIDKVSKVIPEIKRVKTGMDGIKGKRTPASDALNNLPNREIHSKTIGSATQGIVNMFTVLEKKTDFEGLKSELPLVQQESQKVSLDQKDLENLDKLATIESDISMMYQTLDTWKSSLKDPKSATLADYFPIFSHAKSVSEITLDFDETAKSLQMLIDKVTDQGVKDKLITVQTRMREMNSVGMKFSDYSKVFDDLKTTLSALDTFFANYGKRAAPSPGSSQFSLETTTVAIAAAISIDKTTKIVLFAFLSIVVFLILLIVGASIWHKRRQLKARMKEYERSKKEAKEQEKERESEREKQKTTWSVDKSKSLSFELNKQNNLIVSEKIRGKATDELLVKLTQIKKITDEKSAKSIQRSSRTRKGAEKSKKEYNSDIYPYFWKFVKWNLTTTFMKEKKHDPKKVCWYKNKKYAKEVKFPIENSMFLTEPPQNSDEAEGFWQMIVKKEVEQIAMLREDTPQTESDCNTTVYQYFPLVKNGEITFGSIKIKCAEVTEEYGGSVEYRKLEVDYQKNTKTISHSQYKRRGLMPLSPYMLATILGKVRSSKHPAVVHGEKGEKGTPEVFVFMEFLLQMMKKSEGQLEYYDALVNLRQMVPNAVKSNLLFGLSIVSVFAYLYGNEVCPFIQKLFMEYSLPFFLEKDKEKSNSKKKSTAEDLSMDDAELEVRRKQLSEKIAKKEKNASSKKVKSEDGKSKKSRKEQKYFYGEQVFGYEREKHLVTVEDIFQDMMDFGEDDKDKRVVKDKDNKDLKSKETDGNTE
ncbi:hypothetical protein CAEBREN_28828 [Caenorhabditis brenneri]|uniref:Tyrosine-protein phosphatase domain-containing protein n=1 Tax=Caenorhabditis brenneri TaxID=135651 RepID=G0NWU1_CAEBE|nr:hypothetical protein CAEBREN_28828 [Caenorhabditis brenneri]